MKCARDGVPGVGRTVLVAAVLMLATKCAAFAEDDPVTLPPAAAEALRANGSVLEGSLIDALAEGETRSRGERDDAEENGLILLAEQLLRAARQLESLDGVVPDSAELAKDLRTAALHCLARGLGRSIPSRSPEPADSLMPLDIPELPHSTDGPDSPPVDVPSLEPAPSDASPVEPPALDD